MVGTGNKKKWNMMLDYKEPMHVLKHYKKK